MLNSDIITQPAIIKKVAKNLGYSEKQVEHILKNSVKYMKDECVLDSDILAIRVPYLGILYFNNYMFFNALKVERRLLRKGETTTPKFKKRLTAGKLKAKKVEEFEKQLVDKVEILRMKFSIHNRKPISTRGNFLGGFSFTETEKIQNEIYEKAR